MTMNGSQFEQELNATGLWRADPHWGEHAPSRVVFGALAEDCHFRKNGVGKVACSKISTEDTEFAENTDISNYLQRFLWSSVYQRFTMPKLPESIR